ncbi:MAG TPA: HAD family hydrolase [Geobacteraceae bacterium]|nr:HAD family hydrolase [Geobacteraceae bacterium]
MFSDLRSLVFDLDGTLYVNNELGREIHLCGCRYISEMRGIPLAEAGDLIRATRKSLTAEQGIESTLSHACLALGGDLREMHRRFAEEIRPDGFLSPDERVIRLLYFLGSRFELFIYTNNNIVLSSRIMGLIGVSGMFRRVFTIEDYWRPKPDRSALERIYRAMGRKPAECMFIGDRYDVDLRLPAAMGSTVFLSTSVEELFPLNKIMQEEEL